MKPWFSGAEVVWAGKVMQCTAFDKRQPTNEGFGSAAVLGKFCLKRHGDFSTDEYKVVSG
jgi:hypothetical protein